MQVIKDKLSDLFYLIGDFSVFRNLVNSYQGKAAILMYHRVLPADDFVSNKNFNSDLIVSLERFEEQMRYLSNLYRLIPMDDLSGYLLYDGDFAVAVTFDDGYKDILTYALPVLEKYHIPATIYISTRFPEGDCRMWWYELAEICESRTSVEFEWKGKMYRWHLLSWAQKCRCFREIRELIYPLSDVEINALMTLTRKSESSRDYHLHVLTWNDICELSRHPLITIGAHTHSHSNLTRLPTEETVQEIQRCSALLRNRIGDKVKHFSYPYGALKNVGESNCEILENCGFETAVTARCDFLTKGHPPFRLPRFSVFDQDDANRLDVKLSGWNVFFYKHVVLKILRLIRR